MSFCSKCKTEQPDVNFNVNSKKKSGRASHCKSCVKEYKRNYYLKNSEKIAESVKIYREKNPDKAKERFNDWVSKNTDRVKEIKAKWALENPEKRKASCAKWASENPEWFRTNYLSRHKRVPGWVNKSDLLSVYKEARRITEETGVVHHVDHIVPLRGELVSGLHVVENLQILPASENLKKGNRY